jgi:hypothetical protein
MASLSTGQCGSYLHGLQKHEIHLYPTGFELEAVKVAQVDQGLRAGCSLSPGYGKHCCRRVKSQGSLQLLAGCMLDWRSV